MVIHRLKILPEYFGAQKNRVKTFEIRKNDRNFKVGDRLMLYEINLKTKQKNRASSGSSSNLYYCLCPKRRLRCDGNKTKKTLKIPYMS